MIFTATSDLHSEFPAYAARQLGFGEVPLICARELEIEGSMPRVVRMLAHVETDLPRADITHVYLHGAAALRRDLTRVRAVPMRGEAVTGPVQSSAPACWVRRSALALRRHDVEVALRDVSLENLRIATVLGAGERRPGRRTPAAGGRRGAARPPGRGGGRGAHHDRRRRHRRGQHQGGAARAHAGAGRRRPAGALRGLPPDGRQRALGTVRRVGRAVRRPAVGGRPARRGRPRRPWSWWWRWPSCAARPR